MNAGTSWSPRCSPAKCGPPLADRHGYRVGPDGQPFALPGMGGVTLGVHCGDPATGYASDHLEPGASVRHRDPAANLALQFLTCVGNPVRVDTGPAAGAVGHVIGQHAYVLADFPEPVLAGLTTGDAVTVTAPARACALAEHAADRGEELLAGTARARCRAAPARTGGWRCTLPPGCPPRRSAPGSG